MLTYSSVLTERLLITPQRLEVTEENGTADKHKCILSKVQGDFTSL